jgi:hypothetical protein
MRVRGDDGDLVEGSLLYSRRERGERLAWSLSGDDRLV